MGFLPRIRLVVDYDLANGVSFTLEKDQSHYLATVMRKTVGDQVALFNGRDGEWWADLSEVSKRAVTVTVTEQLRPQQKEPDIWLAFAPIKSARTDFIVEKATELGVAHLLPIRTDRTNAARIKEERFNATVREAAEQCERLTLATVAPYQPLSSLLASWPEDRALFFADEMLEGRSLMELAGALPKGSPCGLLIGPEGGFTKQERSKILAHKATIACHLGPRILRADTAALAGLSLLHSAIGDW